MIQRRKITEEYNNGGLLLASSNYVGNLGQNSGAAVSVAVGGAAGVGYSNTDGNPDVIGDLSSWKWFSPSAWYFSTGGGGPMLLVMLEMFMLAMAEMAEITVIMQYTASHLSHLRQQVQFTGQHHDR